jgi:hypothetical protein
MSATKEEQDISKIFLKQIKEFFIGFFVEFARKVFFWLPTDEDRGHALLIFHGICSIALFTSFFLFPPRHLVRFLIIFMGCLVIMSQLLFNGCVITKAEHRLTKKNNTMLDNTIRLFGFEPTNKMRMFTTFATFLPALSILFLSFLSDFWWTRTAYLVI